MATEGEVKNYKVRSLMEREKAVQKRWREDGVHEVNAPKPGEKQTDKYFVTFPFPYMNGKLHLGHAFTISKCEFAVRFRRLLGEKVLFPFGFHCTGMPIKACADKIRREIDTYGFPPVFPAQEDSAPVVQETSAAPVDKSKGKKSKAAAKAGTSLYQYEIMLSLGVEPEDIKKMADASYWLDYFPPIAMADLQEMGIHVDWRRSFLTTDVNPFFDSFVRWQFIRLKERGKIKFGKRYTIFSPRDGQPCMDHDRSAGEGVGPQQYTLIKMKLVKPYPPVLKSVQNKDVFLVAATLRPETMYGQTNVWVKPDGKYIAFLTAGGEVFVCTARAARNMSYQGFTSKDGEVTCLVDLEGSHLLGAQVEAPLALVYPKVYILPMLNIKEDKGTGVVTSVPSDSPDDYATLMDLKNKKALREKYNISDDQVLPYEPVPIIDVPEFGSLGAVKLYQDLKIQSQNDKDKLEQAKEMIYLKEFYEGVMIVGEHKGKMIKDIKKTVANSLIEQKLAVEYYEPEKKIVSRSGEECVVALCDQWYLDYGETEWRKQTELCLKNLNTYHEEVRRNFEATLDWLHEHACSRTYGLGSRLPWDESWLIESLSDSTIYNAYYTVAHLLQGGSLFGNDNNALGIPAKKLTPPVWDYIFLDAPFPKDCGIKKDSLDKLKREFKYWYPVDMRCSGKDLIQNHLTYFLYCHTAMWPDNQKMWPRGARANGHLMLNSAKMSKSEGNFLTLRESLIKYGADATRLALADAGDSVEDANFLESSADSAVLRLYTFVEWVEEILSGKIPLRTGDPNLYHDRVFQNEMDLKINETREHYENTNFKEALRTGVFELQKCRDKYRELTQRVHMNEKSIRKFIEVAAILIWPICPHLGEHVLNRLGKDQQLVWPQAATVDHSIVESSEYLVETAHSFRIQLRNFKNYKQGKVMKTRKQPGTAVIWIAETYPPWQATVLSTLEKLYKSSGAQAPDNKAISVELSKNPQLSKYMKRVMPFVQMVKERVAAIGVSALRLTLEFDEAAVLNDNLDYLMDTLDLHRLSVRSTKESGAPDKVVEETTPGCPFIEFEEEGEDDGTPVKFINTQACSSHFQTTLSIRNGDTVLSLSRRLANGMKIEVWRFKDPELGPRHGLGGPAAAPQVRIDSRDSFAVDPATKSVQLKQAADGKLVNFGSTLAYTVSS